MRRAKRCRYKVQVQGADSDVNNDKMEPVGSEEDARIVVKILERISRAEADLSRILLESESSATEHGTDAGSQGGEKTESFEEHGEPKSRREEGEQDKAEMAPLLSSSVLEKFKSIRET
jgi:hypothetical protein